MSVTHPPRSEPGEPSALARFFLVRPIFAILLTASLVISGLMAYQSIVKEAAPDLAIPQATVETEWPGADPETMEKQVTNEIEKRIKSLKGLKQVRSASFDSFSIIAVEFRSEADLTESMQLLREKVRDAEPDLPKEARKPRIEQVSVDDTPILTIALFGPMDAAMLGNAAAHLKDRLEKVPGVKKVELGGRRKEVVWVLLDPGRLVSLGISATAVRDKIQAANVDMPWDKIESDEIGAVIRLQGRFREVRDLEDLPVARIGSGRVVRLGEIAHVRRDLERETSRVMVSWRGSDFGPAVDISVLKVPGVDTLKTIDGIKEVLAREAKGSSLPYGIEYRITSDQSEYVWEKLRDVFNNGWQAMLCVFVVLFFMLSWREALVAGLSIPVTFLGALAVVQALGYTLNEMVIIGMVIALGLLVDVFILMMEGMHEGVFGHGLTFEQAAVRTVRTYAMPAFAGQATTILAMVPLFGIGGVDGKFIRIIPVTAICCLVLSFVIALLVDIPLSRAVFRNVKSGGKPSRIDRLTEICSARLAAWSLTATLRSKWTALACVGVTVVLLVLSVLGMGLLPSLLYPKADGRNLGVTVELAPDTTLAVSERVAGDLGEILRAKPYLESVAAFVGQKSPLSRNSIGESLVPFKDPSYVGFSCIFTKLEDRDRMAFEYLDELRTELTTALARYPGSLLVFTPQTGGSTTEDPIQIRLEGDDIDLLRAMSNQVQTALRSIPGTTDVRDNLGPMRQDVVFRPKREALDFYGISQDDLAYQVRFAMTDDEVGKFPLGGTRDDLEIRMGTSWPSREGLPGGPTRIEEVALIRPVRPNGETVSVFSILDPVLGQAPLSITHDGGQRAVTVLAKTENRTVNEILADLEPGLQAMRAEWSSGYDYRFGGEAESAAETYGSASKMFVVAIFLVFALLALQFGSFTQPFIIMLSLPFALIGTFGGFFLAWIPFSFPAMIGIISLVGIVVNDAIVMIETMNTHRKGGLSVREAAARGAADRLRPILSTTITTVVGLVPLALSNPMWMPLCNAIIFGLISATLISQLVIPCLYLLMTPSWPGESEVREVSNNEPPMREVEA
ncbi:MAG: efflux RND transporter permease subunit [Deltaproteobacteria bacterium]|nr:efflux RND transporter permease subunit [Deltaproteobacteria bacterium]